MTQGLLFFVLFFTTFDSEATGPHVAQAVQQATTLDSHPVQSPALRSPRKSPPPAAQRKALGTPEGEANIAALAALYDATQGDLWANNANWDPTASPTLEELDTWHGLTVHLGKLTELQLDDNHLVGMLPPELEDLADLQVLWMDGNTIEGDVPEELGQLTQLRSLLMSHNQMSGSIPEQLGNLEELQTLWLHDNGLSGMIPSTLGNLPELRSLVLSQNILTGRIPEELGRLGQLETLWLNENALSGEVPSSIGNLEALQQLVLDDNDLSGTLPRSLLGLQNLTYLSFEGQALCAPSDDAFQAWLRNIAVVRGLTCIKELYWTGHLEDLSFPFNQGIVPVTFPAAMGGVPPYVYTLNPALPTGLMFDLASRLLMGTPSVVTDPAGYTYTASDTAGTQISQTFSIEVIRSLSTTDDLASPESFTLQGNYPNPFREATQVVVDLPTPAVVSVEVMDLIGRQVFEVPPIRMSAGKGQNIPVIGSSLTSGVYIYRVSFSSQSSMQVRYGRLLRIQ